MLLSHSRSLCKFYSYSTADMFLYYIFTRYSMSNNGVPLKQSVLGVIQGHVLSNMTVDGIADIQPLTRNTDMLISYKNDL